MIALTYTAVLKATRGKDAGQLDMFGLTTPAPKPKAPRFDPEAPVPMPPRAEAYINGDAAKFTGDSQVLHGGVFHEVELLEGHLKGQRKWTGRPPPGGVRDKHGHSAHRKVVDHIQTERGLNSLPPLDADGLEARLSNHNHYDAGMVRAAANAWHDEHGPKRPPGHGWTKIPDTHAHGGHGGWHRRKGHGWEQWYPHGKAPKTKELAFDFDHLEAGAKRMGFEVKRVMDGVGEARGASLHIRWPGGGRSIKVEAGPHGRHNVLAWGGIGKPGRYLTMGDGVTAEAAERVARTVLGGWAEARTAERAGPPGDPVGKFAAALADAMVPVTDEQARDLFHTLRERGGLSPPVRMELVRRWGWGEGIEQGDRLAGYLRDAGWLRTSDKPFAGRGMSAVWSYDTTQKFEDLVNPPVDIDFSKYKDSTLAHVASPGGRPETRAGAQAELDARTAKHRAPLAAMSHRELHTHIHQRSTGAIGVGGIKHSEAAAHTEEMLARGASHTVALAVLATKDERREDAERGSTRASVRELEHVVSQIRDAIAQVEASPRGQVIGAKQDIEQAIEHLPTDRTNFGNRDDDTINEWREALELRLENLKEWAAEDPAPAPAEAATKRSGPDDAPTTVSFSDGDGITVSGTSKAMADDVKAAARASGLHVRWYGKGQFWYVPRSRDWKPFDHRASRVHDFAKRLTDLGHPTSAEQATAVERTTADRVEEQRTRAGERAERMEGRMKRALAESTAARTAERGISDRIPFGQPILVGHHSEKRARRDQERIQNLARKQYEAHGRAAEASAAMDRADAVAAGVNDTTVKVRRRLERLRTDLRKLERHRKAYGDHLLVPNVADLKEQIAHWAGELKTRGVSDVTETEALMTRFTRGAGVKDGLRGHGVITQVNKKTVRVKYDDGTEMTVSPAYLSVTGETHEIAKRKKDTRPKWRRQLENEIARKTHGGSKRGRGVERRIVHWNLNIGGTTESKLSEMSEEHLRALAKYKGVDHEAYRP